eukprot:4300703-Prymnesium_polylepis.1
MRAWGGAGGGGGGGRPGGAQADGAALALPREALLRLQARSQQHAAGAADAQRLLHARARAPLGAPVGDTRAAGGGAVEHDAVLLPRRPRRRRRDGRAKAGLWL